MSEVNDISAIVFQGNTTSLNEILQRRKTFIGRRLQSGVLIDFRKCQWKNFRATPTGKLYNTSKLPDPATDEKEAVLVFFRRKERGTLYSYKRFLNNALKRLRIYQTMRNATSYGKYL